MICKHIPLSHRERESKSYYRMAILNFNPLTKVQVSKYNMHKLVWISHLHFYHQPVWYRFQPFAAYILFKVSARLKWFSLHRSLTFFCDADTLCSPTCWHISLFTILYYFLSRCSCRCIRLLNTPTERKSYAKAMSKNPCA